MVNYQIKLREKEKNVQRTISQCFLQDFNRDSENLLNRRGQQNLNQDCYGND